jgi:hypothetical protein
VVLGTVKVQLAPKHKDPDVASYTHILVPVIGVILLILQKQLAGAV